MKMLFGEFLIERSIVSSTQVAEALIAQIKAMPSVAEVVFERKLLAADQLLKVLAHQQRSGCDFRGSATELGLWSPGLATAVTDSVAKVRRPLGQVLVELGYLDMAALTSALDGYVEASGHLAVVPAAAPKAKMSAPSAGVELSEPPVGEILDADFVPEFVASYARQYRPALLDLAASLAELTDAAKIAPLLAKAGGELAAGRSAAAFIGTASTGFVLKLLNQGVDAMAADPRCRGGAEMAATLETAVQYLDGVFKCLETDGIESIPETASAQAQLFRDVQVAAARQRDALLSRAS